MKHIIHKVVEITDAYGVIHPVDLESKVSVDTGSMESEVSNGYFCKLWTDSGVDGLEDVEIAFLVRISKYIDHRDNTIRMKDEVMTVKEMAEVVGREYTRLSKMVKGLCEKRVMGKHSTEIIEYSGRRGTVYTVNPYVICRGRMINKRVKSYYSIG